jgi:hypothetical protein
LYWTDSFIRSTIFLSKVDFLMKSYYLKNYPKRCIIVIECPLQSYPARGFCQEPNYVQVLDTNANELPIFGPYCYII